MFLKKYDFSGIRLRIESESELPDTPYTAAFTYDGEDFDYSTELSIVPELPELPISYREGDAIIFTKRLDAGTAPLARPFMRSSFTPGHCRFEIAQRDAVGLNAAILLTNMPVHHAFSENGAFVLHASYIVYNGEAILFSAPCNTGKSTQAELWRQFKNAEIINGDRCLLRLDHKNGRVTAGGVHYCGTSRICRNVTAPVRAIVLLSQAKYNRVSAAGGGEAARALFREASYIAHIGSDAAVTAALAADVASAVSVLRLECLPDEGAVNELHNFLYGGK